MGFFDRKAKCSVCGQETGLNRYRIANKEWVCPNCFQLAGFSKVKPMDKPIQKMTAAEIQDIIASNEGLNEEIGNDANKKVTALLRAAKKQLNDEKILFWVFGIYKTKSLGKDTVRNGLFIATDRQIFFYAERFTGFETESFPFSNISSLEIGKGAMGHKINIIASGNKSEMYGINLGQVDQFVDYVRSKIGKSSSITVSPLPLDPTDQLRKYKSLLDDGIISVEEFDLKKKELLGL